MSQDIDLDPTLAGRHVDPAMPLDAMRRPHRQPRGGRHAAPDLTTMTPATRMPAPTAPAPVLEAWESLLATRYRSSVATVERWLDKASSRPARRP